MSPAEKLSFCAGRYVLIYKEEYYKQPCTDKKYLRRTVFMKTDQKETHQHKNTSRLRNMSTSCQLFFVGQMDIPELIGGWYP